MFKTRDPKSGAWMMLFLGLACTCSARVPSGGAGGVLGRGGETTGGNGAAGGAEKATEGSVVGVGGEQGGGIGGNPTPDGNSGQGGVGAQGGDTDAGGSVAAGGATAVGGTSSLGGNTASGGSNGGSASAGGSSAFGGVTAAGGNPAVGGSAAAGGILGAGGRTEGTCNSDKEEKFSFFVISNAELIRQGGEDPDNPGFSSFGGDLGGITGADKICQTAAEHVSPCQVNKVWHAFLSTTTQNGIDRVGTGPWYDRNGRLWASSLTTLVGDRASDADLAIRNDIPNENGVNNQNPDGAGKVDNHETLTGMNAQGGLYSQDVTPGTMRSVSCGLDVGAAGPALWSPERATCWNWTRKTPEGCPRVGHSWCTSPNCLPVGGGSGTNWLSVSNEGGCAPGGSLTQMRAPTGVRKVGAAGGYGGFYCMAVIPHP